MTDAAGTHFGMPMGALELADADLLDAGAISATGFAPFRGGPLHYAKTRGIAAVTARLRELEQRHGARFRPETGWATLPV
jgi:3-hydroxyacyl-CoA dehydrogenase/enoyl-CoA hydratase/3-hydroxybutyryl-CoA epimerase